MARQTGGEQPNGDKEKMMNAENIVSAFIDARISIILGVTGHRDKPVRSAEC